MSKTYSQLMSLSTLYTGTTDMSQLAIDYQVDEDPAKLAYAFVQNYGLAVNISRNYFNLDADDVDAFALQEMHKTLTDFNTDKNTKVVTVFATYFRNRLRTETQALSYDVRKANTMADSIDVGAEQDDKGNMVDKSPLTTMGADEQHYGEFDLLLSIRGNDSITENEYKYCEIIMKETSNVPEIRDSEMAKRLNISSAAVHYMKKSLAKKLTTQGIHQQIILDF